MPHDLQNCQRRPNHLQQLGSHLQASIITTTTRIVLQTFQSLHYLLIIYFKSLHPDKKKPIDLSPLTSHKNGSHFKEQYQNPIPREEPLLTQMNPHLHWHSWHSRTFAICWLLGVLTEFGCRIYQSGRGIEGANGVDMSNRVFQHGRTICLGSGQASPLGWSIARGETVNLQELEWMRWAQGFDDGGNRSGGWWRRRIFLFCHMKNWIF